MAVTTEKKTYYAVVERGGEGLWVVRVPELAGVASWRPTVTSAMDSIRRLIAQKTGLKVEDFIVNFTWK